MNEIKFSTSKKLKTFLEGVEPVPIKTNVPQWFKNLKHEPDNKTVKGCKPFLDAITSGYLIKMPQDLWLEHNVWDEEKKIFDSKFRYSNEFENLLNVNANRPDTHEPKQLKDSPLVKKNGNLPIYKILNPYTIKTPPGYSCLITAPFNNKEDRFEIVTGIVDTDKFNVEINFPIVLNTDKYKSLKTVIERGTPIAQVFPFKRDPWKMKFVYEERETSNFLKDPFTLARKLIHNYRDFYWEKKRWT